MKNGEEKLVERRVTYTLEHEGKFYIVENVPARVNEETGEQFFSHHSRTTAEDDSDAGQTKPSD
jgi:YgiT-type zinc finger domain-containing protein